MLRFVTGLVLAVVGLLGATIWWESREGSGPWPPLARGAPAAAAAELEPYLVEEPPPAAATETKAEPFTDRAAGPPAASEPPADEPVEETLLLARGEFEELATEPAPADFAEPAPSEEPAEILVSESAEIAEPAPAEPAPVEDAVAMGMPPDRSADLIRRLLGIYESLGSRR